MPQVRVQSNYWLFTATYSHLLHHAYRFATVAVGECEMTICGRLLQANIPSIGGRKLRWKYVILRNYHTFLHKGMTGDKSIKLYAVSNRKKTLNFFLVRQGKCKVGYLEVSYQSERRSPWTARRRMWPTRESRPLHWAKHQNYWFFLVSNQFQKDTNWRKKDTKTASMNILQSAVSLNVVNRRQRCETGNAL